MNKEKNKKFLKIFIIYFVILVAFVLVRVASAIGLFNGIKNETVLDIVSTSIIQIGILFVIPFCMYLLFFKKKPKQLFEDFGYKKLNFKAVLICFGIGALAYILNLFVSNLFIRILYFIGYNPSYSGATEETTMTFVKFLVSVVSVAIMPAIFEEFVHRGLLLRGTSDVIGYKRAIILSSVLFGLMHMNISQFFYATILGLLMGVVAVMTRSIWPAVIIHFCNNFLNVLSDYLSYTEFSSFSISNIVNNIASQSFVLFVVFVVVAVTLSIIGILILLKKLFLYTGFKNYNQMFDDIESKLRQNNENVTDSEIVMVFEKFVFPNLKNPTNIFDLYINDKGQYFDFSFKYKIPMISCIVLGTLITVFTFIWGVI